MIGTVIRQWAHHAVLAGVHRALQTLPPRLRRILLGDGRTTSLRRGNIPHRGPAKKKKEKSTVNANLPRRIVYYQRGYNLAGRGNVPGTYVYMDPGTGKRLDNYLVRVIQIGPAFSLAIVSNNPAMGRVRIDHAVLNGCGPAQMGDVFLTTLAFPPEGPRAQAAWKVQIKHGKGPSASRTAGNAGRPCVGIITEVHPTYGRIVDLKTQESAFVHINQLRGRATLTLGLRVQYTLGHNGRGPTAFAVYPC